MEENSIIKDKKDKMLMIVIGCLSVVLILLFIFFLVERSENKKHIAAIREVFLIKLLLNRICGYRRMMNFLYLRMVI